MKRHNWIAFIPFYLLVFILFIAAASGGSYVVTTISEVTTSTGLQIIIDAGHGGIDGGATSCTGVLESQLNLEIALRLDCVFRLLGYQTIMIRTEDVSIYTNGNTIAAQKISDLKERVRIVNESDNALLVSIHQNTYPDGSLSGAQVFYGPQGNSMELARDLQSELINHLNPGSNRKSKRAEGIYLMQHIDHPGILVECGFISNPTEEAMLRDTEYQQKLACIIASSICSFVDA